MIPRFQADIAAIRCAWMSSAVTAPKGDGQGHGAAGRCSTATPEHDVVDSKRPESELLIPLPTRSFRIEEIAQRPKSPEQGELSF
jgi:hypothetical protein